MPYMHLEEGLLEEEDAPLVRLEHEAIRRGLRRLRSVNSAVTVDGHAAQAVLAITCHALLEHLHHERTAYLPRVQSLRQ